MIPPKLSIRLAVLLFLPIAASGCGFIFTHGPPPGHQEMNHISCTETNVGPILDTVWGGLNLIGSLAASADPDAYENPDQIALVGISWAIVSGTAAGVGFGKTARCRKDKVALARREAGETEEEKRPAVTDRTVQAVVITPSVNTLAVGQRVQLQATAHNSSGAVVPNRNFTWSSSNDAIASVGRSGLVTAHAPGEVVVAANTGGVVGTAAIVVRR